MSNDTVRVAKGACWSCCSSGFCCRMFSLGPIEEAQIRALDARGVAALARTGPDEPWTEARTGPDGRSAWFLRKVQGACVFLRDDNLCAIHAALGEDAKPDFCREYPYYIVRDPRGYAVINRADCAGWHETFDTGEPVPAQIALMLSRPGTHTVGRFLPERVVVLPGLDTPVATWMDFEARLLAQLADQRGEPEALVCELRNALAQELALELPTPDPARYRLAARAVTATLAMVVDSALASDGAPSTFEEAFTIAMRDRLALATQALESGFPGDEAVPRRLDARTAALFNLVLRNHLLGKLFRPLGSVAAGLGLYLAGSLVARGAQAPVAGGTLSHEAVGEAHAGWSRLATNTTVHRVIARAAPAMVDLFLHAPAGAVTD